MLIIKDKHSRLLNWDQNNFPDNQIQFKMLESDARKAVSLYASIPDPSSLDLFLQAIFTLKRYGLEKVKINYFYGARSDKDVAGEYAVANVAGYVERMIDAVCDTTLFINNNSKNVKKQSSPSISVLAPHCELDESIHSDYSLNWSDFIIETLRDYDMIVFPDESAYTRFSHLIPDSVGYGICEKHRDQESGNIISHKIPELPSWVSKIILIDDLVDGGRSPLNLAATLSDNVKADLFVFHGVLSNNALPKLLAKFNKIIVTNSLPEAYNQRTLLSSEDQDRVQILDVW